MGTLVHWAARDNSSVNLLNLFLGAGASVHLIDKDDQTPLHWACVAGAEDACKLLLKYKAKCNAIDFKGRTPLHLAALSGNEDVACLLVAHKGCILPACAHGMGTVEMLKRNGKSIRMLQIVAKAHTLNVQ
mmetsp:Transcript_5600/g.7573  ORF Transcript_5600/g.7573 Transcript_5600/m.7573 type:complete len:131 (-) Transcript_5600:69-461(-)